MKPHAIKAAVRTAGDGRRKQMPKHKDRALLALTLLFADFAAIFFGLLIASTIRFGDVWTGLDGRNFLAVGPIYILSASAVGALSGEALIRLADTLKRGMLAVAITSAMLLYLVFALQVGEQVSRVFLTLSIVCVAIMMLALRPLHLVFARARLDGQLHSVLLLHDGQFPTTDGDPVPIDVAGRFDLAGESVEDYHRLAKLLSSCDRVVVRCSAQRRSLWGHVLQGMNVRAEIVAPEISGTHAQAISHFAGEPTFVVAHGPLNLRDRAIKRGFDLAVAGTALIVMLPMLLIVAAAIKIDSRGSFFFRQKRIGRQNRPFDIFKFRSMQVENCDPSGLQSASRDDKRITKVGRIIRRTSIDELPQILNVLKGDMSIVGPRPHPLQSTAQSKLFWEIDPRYWYRHACKPGITGLAQIRGYRGATHEERDLTDRLESDLEYVRNWSFWNDISIILKTFMVLTHRNAY